MCPRIVVGLRPAQPRPRPRYSMCVARQLNSTSRDPNGAGVRSREPDPGIATQDEFGTPMSKTPARSAVTDCGLLWNRQQSKALPSRRRISHGIQSSRRRRLEFDVCRRSVGECTNRGDPSPHPGEFSEGSDIDGSRGRCVSMRIHLHRMITGATSCSSARQQRQ